MLVVAHVGFWWALACESFWWASGKLSILLVWAVVGFCFLCFVWWTFSDLFVAFVFFPIVLFTKPALAGLNSSVYILECSRRYPSTMIVEWH